MPGLVKAGPFASAAFHDQVFQRIWVLMLSRDKRCRLSHSLQYAIITGFFVALLTGCTVKEVDLRFDEISDVSVSDDETARMIVGHFSDRRGEKPNWVGRIFSLYVFPTTTLVTTEPVTLAVRRIVERGAEARGLLSVRGADIGYQLSGEIISLEARIVGRARAHAELKIRLTSTDGSKEIYSEVYNVWLRGNSSNNTANGLVDLLEKALNQAIAEALDSEELRTSLNAADDA